MSPGALLCGVPALTATCSPWAELVDAVTALQSLWPGVARSASCLPLVRGLRKVGWLAVFKVGFFGQFLVQPQFCFHSDVSDLGVCHGHL